MISSDIESASFKFNFLKDFLETSNATMIITNPPFSLKNNFYKRGDSMKIKLTEEQLKEVRDEQLTIEGETMVFIGEVDGGMDDNGKWFSYLFKSKKQNKIFEVVLNFSRYGYEDYGYEMSNQDGWAYEVEEQEIVTTIWKRIP